MANREIIELTAGGQGAYLQTSVTFAGDSGRTKILWKTTHTMQNLDSQIKPILQILK